ncbi:hypothetical protein SEPCBS119000_002286 [Sporothrix epigloea]|uniref:Protein ECM13 n=1 Tax=Sporothrix epigloea TaxID=1892477 RepID=A0ABP0DFD1_9PEZI
MTTTTTSSGYHLAQSPSPALYTSSAPPQRKTMSITQTYFLAHKARAKLSSQAARPDHNLRLLVGHANLLDALMLELAEAEREQESWFNQSVRGASQNKTASAPPTQHTSDRHVQWAVTAMEEHDQDLQSADTDDDSDASSDISSDYSDSDDENEVYDEESPVSSPDDKDSLMADTTSLYRVSSHKAIPDGTEDTDEEDEFEDDEATDAQLTLTRSPSHSSPALVSSPPELVIEDDSDIASDDDEAMPPSPPAVTLQSFDKKIASTITTIRALPLSPQEVDEHDAFEHGSATQYYVAPRNRARHITALPVY